MDLSIMRNGYQSIGQPIDDELLDIIVDCIKEYKANKDEPF